MLERLHRDLGRFSALGRRRVIGYLVLSGLVSALCLASRDDFGDVSTRMLRVRWAQYLLGALVFHFGLPALAVMVAALVKRAWSVALMALPLVMVAVGPELPASPWRAEGAAGGRRVTLMSVNVLMINRTIDPILKEIEAARPDVLLVQEYAPQWHAALTGAMTGYHYAGIVREDSFGAAIYSRIPFREEPRVDVRLGTWDLPQLRAVLDVGERGLALYNLHLVPPSSLDYVAEHRRQLRDLAEALRAERLPAIVAGDFNFTPRMPQARSLASLGLVDVHQVTYSGRPSTWPVIGLMRYLPGIALDHVFVSPELDPVSSGIGTGLGSDHRPLQAVVMVP